MKTMKWMRGQSVVEYLVVAATIIAVVMLIAPNVKTKAETVINTAIGQIPDVP